MRAERLYSPVKFNPSLKCSVNSTMKLLALQSFPLPASSKWGTSQGHYAAAARQRFIQTDPVQTDWSNRLINPIQSAPFDWFKRPNPRFRIGPIQFLRGIGLTMPSFCRHRRQLLSLARCLKPILFCDSYYIDSLRLYSHISAHSGC
jgi:hypothetical protein